MGLVGALLMVLGLVALLAGIAGGIATMVKELRAEPQAFAEGFDPIGALEKVLKALTEFLKALGSAPVWLALVVIGFAAIAYGGYLVGAA